MDVYISEIVVRRMGKRANFARVSNTLQAALSRTTCTAKHIGHSNQGWHYKMQPNQVKLTSSGVTQNMSRKGNCFDKTALERFFGTLKAENFHLAAPNRFDALEVGVDKYARNDNHQRIKLKLNGISAVEYRLENTA